MMNLGVNVVVVLYAMAVAGAGVMGLWQADIIHENKPIRHGRWWLSWAITALILAYLFLRTWWTPVAATGMMCVFSTWFRLSLNMHRDKAWTYMGAEPAGSSTFLNALFSDLHGRSWYDLLCWVLSKRIGIPPIAVALSLETAGATLAAYITNHYLPS